MGIIPTDGFIEIYNPTGKDVDLTDYELQDGTGRIKAKFPEGAVIKDKEYQVIAFSDLFKENFGFEPNYVLPGFSIEKFRGTIALIAKQPPKGEKFKYVDYVRYGETSKPMYMKGDTPPSSQDFIPINLNKRKPVIITEVTIDYGERVSYVELTNVGEEPYDLAGHRIKVIAHDDYFEGEITGTREYYAPPPSPTPIEVPIPTPTPAAAGPVAPTVVPIPVPQSTSSLPASPALPVSSRNPLMIFGAAITDVLGQEAMNARLDTAMKTIAENAPSLRATAVKEFPASIARTAAFVENKQQCFEGKDPLTGKCMGPVVLSEVPESVKSGAYIIYPGESLVFDFRAKSVAQETEFLEEKKPIGEEILMPANQVSAVMCRNPVPCPKGQMRIPPGCACGVMDYVCPVGKISCKAGQKINPFTCECIYPDQLKPPKARVAAGVLGLPEGTTIVAAMPQIKNIAECKESIGVNCVAPNALTINPYCMCVKYPEKTASMKTAAIDKTAPFSQVTSAAFAPGTEPVGCDYALPCPEGQTWDFATCTCAPAVTQPVASESGVKDWVCFEGRDPETGECLGPPIATGTLVDSFDNMADRTYFNTAGLTTMVEVTLYKSGCPVEAEEESILAKPITAAASSEPRTVASQVKPVQEELPSAPQQPSKLPGLPPDSIVTAFRPDIKDLAECKKVVGPACVSNEGYTASLQSAAEGCRCVMYPLKLSPKIVDTPTGAVSAPGTEPVGCDYALPCPEGQTWNFRTCACVQSVEANLPAKECPPCPAGQKPDTFTCKCSVPVSIKKEPLAKCKIKLTCEKGKVPDIQNCGCVTPEERKKQQEEYYGATVEGKAEGEAGCELEVLDYFYSDTGEIPYSGIKSFKSQKTLAVSSDLKDRPDDFVEDIAPSLGIAEGLTELAKTIISPGRKWGSVRGLEPPGVELKKPTVALASTDVQPYATEVQRLVDQPVTKYTPASSIAGRTDVITGGAIADTLIAEQTALNAAAVQAPAGVLSAGIAKASMTATVVADVSALIASAQVPAIPEVVLEKVGESAAEDEIKRAAEDEYFDSYCDELMKMAGYYAKEKEKPKETLVDKISKYDINAALDGILAELKEQGVDVDNPDVYKQSTGIIYARLTERFLENVFAEEYRILDLKTELKGNNESLVFSYNMTKDDVLLFRVEREIDFIKKSAMLKEINFTAEHTNLGVNRKFFELEKAIIWRYPDKGEYIIRSVISTPKSGLLNIEKFGAIPQIAALNKPQRMDVATFDSVLRGTGSSFSKTDIKGFVDPKAHIEKIEKKLYEYGYAPTEIVKFLALIETYPPKVPAEEAPPEEAKPQIPENLQELLDACRRTRNAVSNFGRAKEDPILSFQRVDFEEGKEFKKDLTGKVVQKEGEAWTDEMMSKYIDEQTAAATGGLSALTARPGGGGLSEMTIAAGVEITGAQITDVDLTSAVQPETVPVSAPVEETDYGVNFVEPMVTPEREPATNAGAHGTGDNGIALHDETSEDVSKTWEMLLVTPGRGPGEIFEKPAPVPPPYDFPNDDETICGEVTKSVYTDHINPTFFDLNFTVPPGYEIIKGPFGLDCGGDDFEMTFDLPDNFKDVKVLKCAGTMCMEEIRSEISREEIICDGMTTSSRVLNNFTTEREPLDPLELKVSVEYKQRISPEDNVASSEGYSIEFTGEIPEFNLKMATPESYVAQPLNPSLGIVGSPIIIEANVAQAVGAVIKIPYKEIEGFESNGYAIYVRVGELGEEEWFPLNSTVDPESKTISAKIDDFTSYLFNGKALFAVMGIYCKACTKSKFEKVFDPKVRDAIVLVHGLTSTPATWQFLIDDMALTKQPYQIWSLAYPSSLTIDALAIEFANHLQEHDAEYDTVDIVTHSLGGLIAQQALLYMYQNKANYPVIDKIRKVILVGTPNEGSPAADVYERLANYLTNMAVPASLFNVNADITKVLIDGLEVQRVPGIKYYVLAGKKPYEFNLGFFTITTEELLEIVEPNDGIITVKSAQTVGGVPITNMCDDFFLIDLSHTELIDHVSARRVIGRILSLEKAQADPNYPYYGYDQYARVWIDNCQPIDRYVIIGRPITELQTPAPINCNCGNGVCGEGEDAVNCPADCANIFSALLCSLSPVLIPLLVYLSLVLSLVYLITKRIQKKNVSRTARLVIYALVV
ncbi:MAG: alpha/beta fold hydrolase, partial [Candidatus Woesearchaeota archaeon]